MISHVKKSLPFLLFSSLLINCSSYNDSLIGGLAEDKNDNEFFNINEQVDPLALVNEEKQLLVIENVENDYYLNLPGFELPIVFDSETGKLLLNEDSFTKFEHFNRANLLENYANYFEDDPKRVGKEYPMLNCSEWAKTHIQGDSAHYVGDTYRENWNIRQRIFEFPIGSNAGPINIYYLGDRQGDSNPDPIPAVSIYQNNTFEITEDCIFNVKLIDQNGDQQDSIHVEIEMIPHGFQFTNPETDSLEIYTLEHIYLAEKLSGIWKYENSDDLVLIGFTEIINGIGAVIEVSSTGEILDFGTIRLDVENSIRGKLQITWAISETGTTWDARMNSKGQFTMTPPGSASFIIKK